MCRKRDVNCTNWKKIFLKGASGVEHLRSSPWNTPFTVSVNIRFLWTIPSVGRENGDAINARAFRDVSYRRNLLSYVIVVANVLLLLFSILLLIVVRLNRSSRKENFFSSFFSHRANRETRHVGLQSAFCFFFTIFTYYRVTYSTGFLRRREFEFCRVYFVRPLKPMGIRRSDRLRTYV